MVKGSDRMKEKLKKIEKMKKKVLKIIKDRWTWILISIYIGFFLGWYLKPSEHVLKCPKCDKLLTPDEACKLFYDCEFGYGTLGNLRCYCNETWKTFGYKDLVEVIKK